MSTHDMNIANQGFPAFRADLNNALAALVSNSSSATEPTTTFAYQFWADTGNDLLKQRNAANDAWIDLLVLSTGAPVNVTNDKITEGNSSIEIVDTGTGYAAVVIDGVETARFNASGYLGIGTSSPSGVITVESTGAYSTALGRFIGKDARLDILNPSLDVIALAAGSGESIAVYTQGSERMRIDSSGNLLVGKTSSSTTTAGNELRAGGLAAFTRSGSYSLNLNRLASDGDIALFQKDGSTVGSISVTSSATAYNTSSDYRLKEDWIPIANPLDRVLKLKPVNFAWKVDGSRVDGFLAHEAQEVVPEAVHGTKDGMRTEEYEVSPAVYEDVVIPAEYDEEGNLIAEERTEQQLVTEAVTDTREVPEYQGIDQSKLVPLLTAALQEAITKIELLEARVDALENA